MIRAELGIDCRRAFATVVIGHSMHCSECDRSDVSEVLRIYNSDLSRIEVITYEDLFAGAERALDITSVEGHPGPSPDVLTAGTGADSPADVTSALGAEWPEEPQF